MLCKFTCVKLKWNISYLLISFNLNSVKKQCHSISWLSFFSWIIIFGPRYFKHEANNEILLFISAWLKTCQTLKTDLYTTLHFSHLPHSSSNTNYHLPVYELDWNFQPWFHEIFLTLWNEKSILLSPFVCWCVEQA